MGKPSTVVWVCERCFSRRATDMHHKFPNTKANRKIYGTLLDKRFNIDFLCNGCNGSHADVETWDENKFRDRATKTGIKLPDGKKSLKG